MGGALQGLRVVEMAGLGPAPFCGMMLADMGAEVLRIERPKPESQAGQFRITDITGRGRHTLAIDLAGPGATDAVLQLTDKADILIEGFRPGVMERLGLGPEVCLARNPRLVYGRMTGWGQDGPLAHAPGHDINYIAMAGALNAIGEAGRDPVVPLNLVGDFGGGAMFLLSGVLAALHHVHLKGEGQVVDAAMVDGAAMLSTMIYGFKADGNWNNRRGENLLDGGAHFYATYACADDKHIAIGAIEPQFYAVLLRLTGMDDPDFKNQMDASAWPRLKQRMADIFRTRTRAEWCKLMEGTDVCFAPVLDWDEAPSHPHYVARKSFVELDGVLQPAPAPRFSKTPSSLSNSGCASGADRAKVLHDWGVPAQAIEKLTQLSAAP